MLLSYRSFFIFPTSAFFGLSEALLFWSGVGCSGFCFFRFSASSRAPGLPPMWRDCSFFFTKVASYLLAKIQLGARRRNSTANS
jgi:hypothetical protein